MNKLLRPTATKIIVVGLLLSHAAGAQVPSPAKKTERVKIINGPELESASEYLTIIRWTTANPGGADVHYGIVRYGTDPKDLSQTAKNPIRLNRSHPETVFRVRLQGLKPRTTYYYTVTSQGSDGRSDEVNSIVSKFTTPAPGARFEAGPPRPVSKSN
jgi:hypothetical protein